MVNVRHLVLLAMLAGCQKGAGLVVVTVSSPTPLPPIARLEVESLEPRHTWMVGNGVTLPASFAIEMPRGFHGHVTLTVTALDAESRPLGGAMGSADVSEGARVDMAVSLWPAPPPVADMAMASPADMAEPIDLTAPPDMTISCANEGGPCTSGVGACQVTGTIVCASGQPACNAIPGAPDTSGTWHAAAASNGSWDWDCDGTIEFQYPSGTTTPPPVGLDTPAECTSATTIQACGAERYHFDDAHGMWPISCGHFVSKTVCLWDTGKCYPSMYLSRAQACH